MTVAGADWEKRVRVRPDAWAIVGLVLVACGNLLFPGGAILGGFLVWRSPAWPRPMGRNASRLTALSLLALPLGFVVAIQATPAVVSAIALAITLIVYLVVPVAVAIHLVRWLPLRPSWRTIAISGLITVAGIIPTASVYAGGGSNSGSSQRLGDLNSPTAAHCDAFRVDQGIGFNTLHIAATTCTDGHVEHIQGTPACTIDVSPLNRATPTLCAVIPGSDGSLKIRAEYSISPATLPFITRAVVVQMQVNGDGNGEGEGLVG